MHFESCPSDPQREMPPADLQGCWFELWSCEVTQQGPGTPLALPPSLCPFGTAPQYFLCSLPLVPAEFHLPLTLDASWPLTSLPCCPHSSPFKCPAPGASCPPPAIPWHPHTGKTVAQAPSLLISCSISYNPDAAAWGVGWTCVSPRNSAPVGLRFLSVFWAPFALRTDSHLTH